MKVLYLVNQYPKNSHTFVRREILAVESQGIDVLRVSIRPADADYVEPADQEESKKTIFLLQRGAFSLLGPLLKMLFRHPLRFFRGLRQSLRLARGAEKSLGYHLAYFAEACALYAICEREKIDHVHAHFSTNPPLVCMILQAMGGPGYSFTAHGSEEYYRALSLKLGEKVAAARFVAAISHFGRSQLQLFAPPQTHSRIHIIHCGLDPSFFQLKCTPPQGNRFLFVGRLCQEKQPLILLQAAAILAERGEDFHLDIIGDGTLKKDVEQFVQEHRLQNCVSLHGTVDGQRVKELLHQCRAFVLPSCAEGLPVVIMEAMALHRPVISTFIAAIPELVRDGVEGWLVPTGDALAFANAIAKALHASAEELQLMADAAALRAKERHHIEESAQRLATLFKKYGATCTQ